VYIGAKWHTYQKMKIKGSLTRDFRLQVFFHESVSPRPPSIPLEPFWIFSKIRGDIRELMFITGVNNTGDKLILAGLSNRRCHWHRRKIYRWCRWHHSEKTKKPKIYRRCQRHRRKIVHGCQRHRWYIFRRCQQHRQLEIPANISLPIPKNEK
jgi:hypothetical protein